MDNKEKNSFDEKLLESNKTTENNQFNPFINSNQPYPEMSGGQQIQINSNHSDSELFEQFEFEDPLKSKKIN